MTLFAKSSFASDPAQSRGRRKTEPESPTRTVFQRDRDRIIHSAAFRRLKHKTQVFVYHEGDHYRTRLTHSLEVAQIARSIARTLGLNEDLAEALALAHDLGHPPFGHAGEAELAQCMIPYGGFDHNVQTLKIVTKLEQKYADFDGLNLTWETLEGTVKHNGPLSENQGQEGNLRKSICAAYDGAMDLWLDTWPSAEAQVAALADDIAYNNHDIDDGLRAGLFEIADLLELPLIGDIFRKVERRYPGLDAGRLIHESVRRLISAMVEDVIRESRHLAAKLAPETADDVRHCDGPVIAFSEEMAHNNMAIKGFLGEKMYRHYRVNRIMSQARRITAELFQLFVQEPETLPTWWYERCDGPRSERTGRVVCDFIAGMTDRFALEEHKRLFSLDMKL